MRALDKLNEQESTDVREDGEKQNRGRGSDKNHSPESSASNKTFGIVEIAVYSRIGQLRLLVKEEITIKPSTDQYTRK